MKELLTSKKFIAMIVGVLVAVGARYGLNLDPTLTYQIVALFMTYIAAQGLTDVGKAAAQIKADAPTPLPDRVQQTVNVTAPEAETKKDGTK